MRNRILTSALMTTALALPLGVLFGGSAFAVKKVPYTQVKVEVAKAYQPDDAFKAVRTAMTTAVANKNTAALFALVGPSFTWTVDGKLSADFNPGGTALENFKVAFGFRNPGAAADGNVDGGPFWDGLSSFALDGTFYQDANIANMICTPTYADADDNAFDQADKKVSAGDDATTWYFTLAETNVMSSAEPKALTVTKVGTVALPLIGIIPPQDGDNPPAPTHLEVLLPSGKSGFIPYSAARPMVSNRLCFSKNAAGKWGIALIDEAPEE
jgi:hypothetical protein